MKTYNPQPLDTSSVELSADLLQLTELLAKNTHEVWATQRIAEGWKYGKERSDERKEHPSLVPYEELSEGEKDYDRNTAMETVRLITKLGYEIKQTKLIKQDVYLFKKQKLALVFDEGLVNIPIPDENFKILWTSNKTLPKKEIFDNIINRTFLMLDADVLRKAGAMVSKRVSWERTATELLWHIQNNPVLSYINQTPEILITFAEDAAVYIKRKNDNIKTTLTLAHGSAEGTLRAKNNFSDSFEKMAAAVALQLQHKKDLQIFPILQAAMNEEFSLKNLVADSVKLDDNQIEKNTFEIPFKAEESDIDPTFWCITNSVSTNRIFDLARDYVLYGKDRINGLPKLQFGNLTTIDRKEIEAFQNISNLITDYANNNVVQPLSIAVFGAPGSGKSFGVKQIAKNILSKEKMDILEFNVSQFTSNANLTSAFHKVRDAVLEGKLPLVFFDEFDSDGLVWLKNFLMPMQDGKFTDENGEHPVGKCILVFAGGTVATFAEFIQPKDEEKFKEKKVPDFVSRLKGFINVLGPNRADDADNNYLLRRALLLRSFCERKLKPIDGIMPINEDVLWAMLLAPKYKHGARSMETIFEMSRIENNEWKAADLPDRSILALHTDVDVFMNLVLRKVLLNSHLERLAKAIHEDYCKKNKGETYDMEWKNLPENIKENNRDTARAFAGFLQKAGYDYGLDDISYVEADKFTEKETLDIAKTAHDVWVESKKAAGYIYGEAKDADKKTHPLLVEWDKLPKEEQQKDIDIAENIIPMMRSVGFKVYKVI